METRFDDVGEGAARFLSQRFSRRSLLGKSAGAVMMVAGGEAAVLAFGSSPAIAAYSPLCAGGCSASCPSGTTASNCWWGCDTWTCNQGCCGFRAKLICDCCKTCSGGCGACGLNPCIYGPDTSKCVQCRRVTQCSSSGAACC